ncbi:MAG TPA: threonine--tRNA ligase [Pseudonocardiaceae bacterium]
MSQPAQFTAAPRVLVPAGTTAGHALRDAGLPGKGPQAVVVVRDPDGRLRDLSWAPADEVEVEAVTADSDDGRAVIRHSTAHVLAQAVQQLYPEARLGIGPPIKDGFYYDFAVPRPFHPDDLEKVEQRMRQIVKDAQRFSRRRFDSVEQAREELASEPFKLELIDLKSADEVDTAEVMEVDINDAAGELTIYDNLDPRSGERVWADLCRGPHLPTTRHIPAFKLTRSAAAYWRGDEHNPQLQRIYGTAWESPEALERHLHLLAEAERRDHRRLGAELDLFSFPEEIGSGLALWLPKGGIVRRAMEDYSRGRHEEAGYEFVYSPHITKGVLFERSRHLQWYAETMYPPMHLDEERDSDGNIRKPGQDYYLKPMNCPMHNLIFAARGRSYRELPLRLFEFGTVYRYEKSGVVHGLTRARGFTQDDAHIYCTPEQLQDELADLLAFVLGLLSDYGLTEFTAELSTRPDKFVGEIEQWEAAEAALEQALRRAGLRYRIAEGEGAFYAPKIDVHATDAIGRAWQLSTLQVDLQMPNLFELEYTAPDGSRQRPYMIHRALFGSIERFFGILTEHYAGAFPAWLAPVQVVGIPVAADHVEHLMAVAELLRGNRIRVEVDAGDDRMQKKIRNHTTQKVPFLLIAGGADVATGAVSFRFRDGSQINGVPVHDAVMAVTAWIQRRENASPSAQTFEITGT